MIESPQRGSWGSLEKWQFENLVVICLSVDETKAKGVVSCLLPWTRVDPPWILPKDLPGSPLRKRWRGGET